MSAALLLAALAAGGVACADDPAVAVSRCLERGLRELRASGEEERTVVCALDLEVPHVVLLSPGGPFDPVALRGAGVPEEALEAVRRWRERDPAVYVVPLGRGAPAPAMTTAQSFFVEIPRLAAVSKSDPHTSIRLRRGEDGVETVSVW